MAKELPPTGMLRKLLRYEPDTGRLYWRERTPDMFVDGKYGAEHNCASWNSRFAGKQTFTGSTGYRYFGGTIFDNMYKAHRVIWAIVYNEWPSGEIDHINGNGFDNRIKNLRHVSRVDNARNTKRRLDNTSGVPGVSWKKSSCKWMARIGINGKHRHLGLFDDFEAAVAARKAAEVKYGYHKNHGRN